LKSTRTLIPSWLFIILIISTSLFVILSVWNIVSTTNFGEIDFMGYWSATYLFRNDQNPYSPELMETMQHIQLQSKLDVTIMAWNPPFLFVFLLPLVWLPFTTAKFVWLMINIIIILAASLMLAHIYLPANSSRLKLIFLLFAISFPQVMSGIYMGQVIFLVFWGLVACMALIKKEQWFWAGAVLIFTTIKPHMAVLAVIYLLIYMAYQHQYRGWGGLLVAGITCMFVLFAFRSNWIYDLIGESAIAPVNWATPTIGGLFSYWGLSESVRYLIILLLPLPFLLARYPAQISMESSVALLTLITVPTTFFGWSYDQTVLLIPIAQIFSWIIRSKHQLLKSLTIIGITCALVINYYQRLLTINEVFYVWIPLFWCLVFCLTWYGFSSKGEDYA